MKLIKLETSIQRDEQHRLGLNYVQITKGYFLGILIYYHKSHSFISPLPQ
jgi:hypothetical protein